MNPFKVFDEIKFQYQSYIKTFQKFKNKEIGEFVRKQTEEGNLLWAEPLLQITKKFRQGTKLSNLVDAGILNKQCLNIFKIGDNVIHPYFHQQQSIEIAVKKQQNLIVTTGTASGKSLCFEIPIINYCLNKKVEGQRGIKAIIIYPMNALANSQYYELAKKLNGTGLKIGIYTGDTKADKDTALQSYRDIFGQDAQPNDSEIISRLEMQNNPPDILITNYVQLELLLTRLEDRGLFPEGYRENLKFLVIDELHTYRGKKATDVAFLIRRLKQRTNTSGNLICIGTSATMVSEKEGVNSDEVVAEFATKFFGEKFLPENVVKETEDETLYFKGEILNPSIEVTEDLINNFNESNSTSIAALYKSLMGSEIKTDFSFEELGEKLKSSKTLSFIETKLSEYIYGFNELADKYHIEVRSTFTKQQAALELLAGFYLGMSGQITTDTGNVVPRFITKLHTFFNQGKELRKCIIDECGYISSSGEITCPKCKEEGRGTVTLLPLHFCRICGQEYFGVGLLKDNKIVPWSMYDFESPEVTGYYSTNVEFKIPDDYPDNWLTPVQRQIKTKYRELVPRQISLDTTNNKYATYYNEDELKGIFIPNPLRICLHCRTEYSGQVREYTKLFLLNSIGRATGTNILTAASINATTGNEKKVIAFSDNRQDSAFQAGHFNDWYNQIFFRQALHQVLEENRTGINIKEVPSKLFDKLIPRRLPRNPRFIRFQRNYLRYLETYLYLEIRGTKKFASQNLEDVGLLEVNYEGLWDWINDPSALTKYDELKKINKELLYDYLTGFMDIFRLEIAINHNDLINKEPFRQEVISFLESEYPEYRLFEALENTKPGGFTDGNSDQIRFKYNPHALSTSRRFSSWIQKAFGPQQDDAIFKETIKFLGDDSGYLIKNPENRQEVLLLTSDLISLKLPSEGFKAKCPRCDAKYNWKTMNYCVQLKCTDPLQNYTDSHNYYFHQYSLIPDSDVMVRAADHSAQVKGDLRKQRENDFKAGKLNLLVSTPTMELGIDIGTLSSIYMRNVPPNPSNYVQRAGRAGRSGQGSLITTFCGSGPGRGSHDQYFYNRPMEMVSGKISMPRFNLDNVRLFLAHVNSLILQTIDKKLLTKPSNILNFEELQDKIPMFNDYKKDLFNSVSRSKQNIVDGIKKAFGKEIENSDGELNWILIENQVNNFVENLDTAFDSMRKDYLESLKEFTSLDDKIRRENQADNSILHVRRTALEKRNQDIKDGEGEFYVYRYLSQVGFLPNYAFPTITKQVRFLYDKAEESISREQVIALTEFAPHNTLYYEGQKFLVEHITGETDLNNQEEFLICEFCGYADKLKTNQTRPTNCISCGSTLENVHSIKALNMPRMRARKRMRITSDEEERIKQGYLTEHSYRLSTNTKHFNLIAAENTFANLSFERSATMFHFNLGFRSEKDRGFIIDPHTNKWLLVGNLQEHFQNNPANARNVIRNLALFVKSENDIVAFRDGIFHGENEESFARTLLYTLLQSISYTLNLDDAELSGFIQLMPDQPSRIIIFEVSEGGTGTLSAILKDSVLLRRIAEKSLEILHIKKDKTDSNDACIKACYNCICSFYNQFYHTQLDRNLVKEFFFKLAELDTIEHIQLQDYDFVYDEFIRQGKSSSLEKEVLSILKELKIQPPESIHEIISHEGILIAEADLFYKPRLCVFIDGPDHNKDYIIKDDAEKRDKLKGLGKNIVVIRYDNLIDDIEKLLYLVSPESLGSPQLLTLKFNYFKSVWKEEKKVISSPSKIQSLESYNKILELGEKVLPLIIDDLKNEPDFWFEALRRLTGTDPVEEKNKGNVKLMSKDWINWYEQRR